MALPEAPDVAALPVEQRDREAAADLHNWYTGQLTAAEDMMRSGKYDDDYRVQSFARHRLAAIDSLTAERDSALAERDGARAALADAVFALEATEACLKTWNDGRGSWLDIDGIISKARAQLENRP